jgi:ADP-ribose pyrophosphatase YjhB (NUDIX family)
MIKVTSAGGFVVKDNEILLIKLDSGKYALPKGHVEPGETFEQAAVREVEEETGVISKIKSYLGDYTRPAQENDGTTVSKTIKIYLLEQTGYTVKDHDENSVWVNILDAINNMHFEQEAKFVNEIQLR